MEFINYYEILGVATTATDEALKAAYKKLTLEKHQDRVVNKAREEREQKGETLSKKEETKIFNEAGAKFSKINAAYQLLLDPEKRAKFDDQLRYYSPADETSSNTRNNYQPPNYQPPRYRDRPEPHEINIDNFGKWVAMKSPDERYNSNLKNFLINFTPSSPEEEYKITFWREHFVLKLLIELEDDIPTFDQEEFDDFKSWNMFNNQPFWLVKEIAQKLEPEHLFQLTQLARHARDYGGAPFPVSTDENRDGKTEIQDMQFILDEVIGKNPIKSLLGLEITYNILRIIANGQGSLYSQTSIFSDGTDHGPVPRLHEIDKTEPDTEKLTWLRRREHTRLACEELGKIYKNPPSLITSPDFSLVRNQLMQALNLNSQMRQFSLQS